MELNPMVSVIVIGKNVEKIIDECLSSIFQMDYTNFEVIYVDGGSTDRSRELVGKYPVRTLIEKKGKRSFARALGIQNAKGNIIAMTDADCYVDRKWLTNLIPPLNQERVVSVGGPGLLPPHDSYTAQCIDILFSTTFGSAGSRNPARYSQIKDVDHNPTFNVAYKKWIFDVIGNFDSNLHVGEDLELDSRIKEAGYRHLYTPFAIVWHHRRGSIKSFLKQIYEYGFWRANLGKQKPSLLKPINVIPSITLLTCLALLIGGLITNNFIPLFIATSLYFFAGFSTGFIKSIQYRDPKLFLILPFLGFLEHLTYGISFIGGILKK